jgi:hypothetical protein
LQDVLARQVILGVVVAVSRGPAVSAVDKWLYNDIDVLGRVEGVGVLSCMNKLRFIPYVWAASTNTRDQVSIKHNEIRTLGIEDMVHQECRIDILRNAERVLIFAIV